MKYATILALVFVVRYFTLDGHLIAATVSYGWTPESCAVKKIRVDAESDPEGTKTVTDCVDESEVSALLARGERT